MEDIEKLLVESLTSEKAQVAKKAPRPITPRQRRPIPWKGLSLFVLRRLAALLLVVVVIAFVCHLCLDFGALKSPDFFVRTPGMPSTRPTFWNVLGSSLVETGRYLGRLLRGDMGDQIATSNVTVWETVSRVYPLSMALLGSALLLGGGLGVLLGIYSARRRYDFVGTVTSAVANLGTTTPSFFMAIFFQVTVLALGWRFLPLGGTGRDAGEIVRAMILPILVLSVRPLAYMTQVTHTAVAESLEADYTRTARSKGLDGSLVLRRHVMPNILIPVLTTLGNTLRFSLSSLPVVEVLFGRDGLGQMIVLALLRRDPALTTGLVLSMAVTFFVLSLLLDLAYRLLDPRLREVPI